MTDIDKLKELEQDRAQQSPEEKVRSAKEWLRIEFSRTEQKECKERFNRLLKRVEILRCAQELGVAPHRKLFFKAGEELNYLMDVYSMLDPLFPLLEAYGVDEMTFCAANFDGYQGKSESYKLTENYQVSFWAVYVERLAACRAKDRGRPWEYSFSSLEEVSQEICENVDKLLAEDSEKEQVVSK